MPKYQEDRFVRNTVEFTLNTDVKKFEDWLNAYRFKTRKTIFRVDKEKSLVFSGVPTPKIEQRAGLRQSQKTTDRFPRHVIKASLVTPNSAYPDNEKYSYPFRVIELVISKGSDQQINITVELVDERMLEYYTELLEEIKRRWPSVTIKPKEKTVGPDIGAGVRGGGRATSYKPPTLWKIEFPFPNTSKKFWRWFDSKYRKANGWIRTPLGNDTYEISHPRIINFESKIKTIEDNGMVTIEIEHEAQDGRWHEEVQEQAEDRFSVLSQKEEQVNGNEGNSAKTEKAEAYLGRGAPPNKDYDWAHREIYTLGKDYDEVEKEFWERNLSKKSILKNPSECFRKAMNSRYRK